MFVGHDDEKQRMEVFELKDHPYYVGVQYHPEYLSRPLLPSPPFLGLILASVKKLTSYLGQGQGKQFVAQSSGESSDESTDTIIQRMNGNHLDNVIVNGIKSAEKTLIEETASTSKSTETPKV